VKRVIKWFIFAAIAVVALRFGGQWALTAWIGHKKNSEAHSMHEGHIIVDEIKAHDPSINATWTNDDRGQPNIVIRNVFDRETQDAIVSWAQAVKTAGRVRRHITIDFQKEIPHSDVPDTILRTEHF
jgi:hypothetical protein